MRAALEGKPTAPKFQETKQEAPKPEAPKTETPAKQETPPPDAKAEAEKQEKADRARDAKGRFAAIAEQADGDAEPGQTQQAQPEHESKGIKQLRSEYERVKKELDELRVKQTPAFDPSEIEAIKKEKERLEGIVAKVKYQETKEYQEKYVKPLESTIKKATNIAGQEHHSKIALLFDMPESDARREAIERIIENSSLARQAEVLRLASEASSIVEARTEAIGDPKSRLAELERQEQLRQQAEQKQLQQFKRNLFDETAKEAANAFELFRAKQGDEAHNKAVERRLKEAESFMLGNPDPDQIAEMTFYAVAGKEAIPMLHRAQKEIQKLTKELEDMRSKRPTFGQGQSTQSKPVSAVEAFLKASRGEEV